MAELWRIKFKFAQEYNLDLLLNSTPEFLIATSLLSIR